MSTQHLFVIAWNADAYQGDPGWRDRLQLLGDKVGKAAAFCQDTARTMGLTRYSSVFVAPEYLFFRQFRPAPTRNVDPLSDTSAAEIRTTVQYLSRTHHMAMFAGTVIWTDTNSVYNSIFVYDDGEHLGDSLKEQDDNHVTGFTGAVVTDQNPSTVTRIFELSSGIRTAVEICGDYGRLGQTKRSDWDKKARKRIDLQMMISAGSDVTFTDNAMTYDQFDKFLVAQGGYFLQVNAPGRSPNSNQPVYGKADGLVQRAAQGRGSHGTRNNFGTVKDPGAKQYTGAGNVSRLSPLALPSNHSLTFRHRLSTDSFGVDDVKVWYAPVQLP